MQLAPREFLSTTAYRLCDLGSCDRYMVSQHPEVEARIVEELRSLNLLASPQQRRVRELQHSDLSRLTYLSCAIKV